ncbi:DUF2304 domain-containing protein [Dermabacteraceae bacterium P13115]|nr:DUF2304 domain-containing protein [Dermabacteraceae bacterium TAE3-ERU5]
MSITLFSLGLAIIVTLVVGLALRSGQLREKYAALWLIVGVGTIVLGAFPELLEMLATMFGVHLASNLLFALGIVLLVMVTLQLSREITTLEDETRVLSEEAALLRNDLEEVKRQLAQVREAGAGEARSRETQPRETR